MQKVSSKALQNSPEYKQENLNSKIRNRKKLHKKNEENYNELESKCVSLNSETIKKSRDIVDSENVKSNQQTLIFDKMDMNCQSIIMEINSPVVYENRAGNADIRKTVKETSLLLKLNKNSHQKRKKNRRLFKVNKIKNKLKRKMGFNLFFDQSKERSCSTLKDIKTSKSLMRISRPSVKSSKTNKTLLIEGPFKRNRKVDQKSNYRNRNMFYSVKKTHYEKKNKVKISKTMLNDSNKTDKEVDWGGSSQRKKLTKIHFFNQNIKLKNLNKSKSLCKKSKIEKEYFWKSEIFKNKSRGQSKNKKRGLETDFPIFESQIKKCKKKPNYMSLNSVIQQNESQEFEKLQNKVFFNSKTQDLSFKNENYLMTNVRKEKHSTNLENN